MLTREGEFKVYSMKSHIFGELLNKNEKTMNNLPVNEVVKDVLFKQHLTAVDLGRSLGLSNDAAYKLLKRSDWKISELKNVGAFVKRNLFELFVPEKVNTAELDAKLKAAEEELSALKRKMEMTEMENKYLKELVEMAKLKLKK
jgi:hypothetical protein